MSYRHVEMVLNSSISDPTEAAVMIALASHADQYFSCYPSIARLCQLSRYKERAVQNAIKRLQERGVIIVKQGGGRGGASFYTIVPAALNPAADAPISGPKPRTRNTVSDTETPHLIPETPHLMRENPAADAPEPIQEPIQEPQSCASAREAGLNQGRVLRMRKALIEAMGLTGSELNTSGTFVVQKMAPADIELSLDVWSREGLTDEQIIAAVRAKVQGEKQKDQGFIPRSARFFDGAIRDHAVRLKRPASPRQDSTQTETAEQRQKRRKRLIGR